MYYFVSGSDDYPESYWFQYNHDVCPTSKLWQYRFLEEKIILHYSLNKKISEKKLLSYDYFSSDAGNFISPKLSEVIMNADFLKEYIQLIDAEVEINGKLYLGYSFINTLRKQECIDMSKSVFKPLVSFMPDGPVTFDDAILKSNEYLKEYPFFSASESRSLLIVSDSFRKLMFENKIKGIAFFTEYHRNNWWDYEVK